MDAEQLTKKIAETNSDLSTEILDYIVETGETIENLQTQKKALQDEIEVLKTERIDLIKVANEAKESASNIKILDKDLIQKTMQNLQNLAMINNDNAEKLATVIKKDPNNIFNVIDILADRYYKIATTNNSGTLIDSDNIKTNVEDAEDAELHWQKLADKFCK